MESHQYPWRPHRARLPEPLYYLPSFLILFDLDPYLSGKMTSQQDMNALSQPISEDSIFPFRKVFFLIEGSRTR